MGNNYHNVKETGVFFLWGWGIDEKQTPLAPHFPLNVFEYRAEGELKVSSADEW